MAASLFFFQAEDGIRDYKVTGVQTCALPISGRGNRPRAPWPGLRALPPGGGWPHPPPRRHRHRAEHQQGAGRAARREHLEIGRASCRERAEMAEMEATLRVKRTADCA